MNAIDMTTVDATAAEPAAPAHAQGLGDENSIWFKLMPLMRGDPENPMRTLMMMADKYGPVIRVNMGNQNVVLSMDIRRTDRSAGIPTGYEIVVHGGRTPTGRDALAWAVASRRLKLGEIVDDLPQAVH